MSSQKLLDGLVALITGGGSGMKASMKSSIVQATDQTHQGFGEGIAQLFAEQGAKVVILDIDQQGGVRQVVRKSFGRVVLLTLCQRDGGHQKVQS